MSDKNDNEIPADVMVALAVGISFALLAAGIKLIHNHGFSLFVITPALFYSAYMMTKNKYDVGARPWIIAIAVADFLILVLFPLI